jgi:hypothetical protein
MKKPRGRGTLIDVVRFRVSAEENDPMNPSEKFLRFAAECEAMVKLARTRESKNTWRGLAARWIRYAELVERQSATAHDRIAKRHQKPERGSPGTGNAEAAA